MKCPKCGYLGFETTERCRHCGYDFSLSVTVDNDAGQALPLRHSAENDAPLADFDLSGLGTDDAAEPAAALDLDRIIGSPSPAPDHSASFGGASAPDPRRRVVRTATAVATPPQDEVQQHYAPGTPAAPNAAGAGAPASLLPLAPPPARAPLAVRRATPEVQRRRAPRTIKRDAEDVGLQLEPAVTPGDQTTYAEGAISRSASALRRLTAVAVDAVILGGISGAVLYLTLAIAGLTLAEWRVIPPVPMAAFLVLLNGGYLIGFTAANGQTIGKMTARIRVTTDDGESLTIGGAVLRALGVMLTVALAGLPYLPVLVGKDRRALHDRLAGTRVIKHAPSDFGSGRPERPGA
jgi:uncharacterized RDD family membrane protein YckC